MMGIGALGMLFFWVYLLALLVGGAVLAFRLASTTGSNRQPSAARQAVDERWARGEISREEYESIRAEIER